VCEAWQPARVRGSRAREATGAVIAVPSVIHHGNARPCEKPSQPFRIVSIQEFRRNLVGARERSSRESSPFGPHTTDEKLAEP
jgi:hypothetical protein